MIEIEIEIDIHISTCMVHVQQKREGNLYIRQNAYLKKELKDSIRDLNI